MEQGMEQGTYTPCYEVFGGDRPNGERSHF